MKLELLLRFEPPVNNLCYRGTAHLARAVFASPVKQVAVAGAATTATATVNLLELRAVPRRRCCREGRRHPSREARRPFLEQERRMETPQPLFDKLNEIDKFEFDVCATPSNGEVQEVLHSATRRAQAALGRQLLDEPALRPRYRRVGEKARASALEQGATVACLLPARTDTAWWHDHVLADAGPLVSSDFCYQVHEAPGATFTNWWRQLTVRVHLIRGRLTFGGAPSSAPFPSALVTFAPPLRASKAASS